PAGQRATRAASVFRRGRAHGPRGTKPQSVSESPTPRDSAKPPRRNPQVPPHRKRRPTIPPMGPARAGAGATMGGRTASDWGSLWRFLTNRRDAPILGRIKTARSTPFAPSTTALSPTWSPAMRRLPICLPGALLLSLLVAYHLNAQEKSDGSTTSTRTFRPVVRGTQYAVSSMKQQATRAAARVLEAGGNAFDAIVAGQAVLA